MSATPNTVIFACVHNAGRSQMAAAFFNALADPQKASALSAGTQPADRPHPEVVEALKEVGIDISDAVPRLLDEAMAGSAQWLVTMGCGEQCPVVPGLKRADWPINDPKGESVERVREIRDEL
ncbi:MAG: arsenate reductase ArsC, partial [Gammaproteobacteria bacterium]|nr:arsenate reductase ArsC [Gammaproteobacteria bacterium]